MCQQTLAHSDWPGLMIVGGQRKSSGLTDGIDLSQLWHAHRYGHCSFLGDWLIARNLYWAGAICKPLNDGAFSTVRNSN